MTDFNGDKAKKKNFEKKNPKWPDSKKPVNLPVSLQTNQLVYKLSVSLQTNQLA